jgi:hypothetical protein
VREVPNHLVSSPDCRLLRQVIFESFLNRFSWDRFSRDRSS